MEVLKMCRKNCKEDIERWLRENCKELVWKRASGDYPPKKEDSLYIHREEGYEIRDLMYDFFEECPNLECNYDNYKKIYEAIKNYKKGEKVKRDELLAFLLDKFCK